jgi:YD repeat-containing protein
MATVPVAQIAAGAVTIEFFIPQAASAQRALAAAGAGLGLTGDQPLGEPDFSAVDVAKAAEAAIATPGIIRWRTVVANNPGFAPISSPRSSLPAASSRREGFDWAKVAGIPDTSRAVRCRRAPARDDMLLESDVVAQTGCVKYVFAGPGGVTLIYHDVYAGMATPLGKAWQFGFESELRAAAGDAAATILGPEGPMEFARDDRGRLVAVDDPSVEIFADQNRYVVVSHAALAMHVYTKFGSKFLLTAVYDVGGPSAAPATFPALRIVRDSATGLPLAAQDRSGGRVELVYARIAGAAAPVVTQLVHTVADGKEPESTWTLGFDAAVQLVAVTSPGPNGDFTERFTYDAAGLIATHAYDSTSLVRAYRREISGPRVIQAVTARPGVDAPDSSWQFTYGAKVLMSDLKDKTTWIEMRFDDAFRLVGRRDSTGESLSFAYLGATRKPVEIKDERDGTGTRYVYDAAGQVQKEVRIPDGKVMKEVEARSGIWPLRIRNAASSEPTVYDYDALGRIVRTSVGAFVQYASFTASAAGQGFVDACTRDNLSVHSTACTRADALGRLVAKRSEDDGSWASISYDGRSAFETAILAREAGEVWRTEIVERDERGLVTKKRILRNGTLDDEITTTYNAAGQELLSSSTREKSSRVTQYNELGYVTSEQIVAGGGVGALIAASTDGLSLLGGDGASKTQSCSTATLVLLCPVTDTSKVTSTYSGL